MGRPPSNGGPSFRFNQAEVTEMEAILQAHHTAMPVRDVLISLADKFSATPERNGKIKVQMKQVWNWFQNRRYALRAKAAKAPGPGKLVVSPMSRDDSAILRNEPQAPTNSLQPPSATVGTLPQAPQHPPASSGRSPSENSQMEFEAKSARDGAWYDVATFLSHRSLETGDPEVLVRFSGFGAEEDEWVNIRKHVRQRSLPCESSECVAVLPGDLILCFQEGKEQALYFDAHVLDAQRRRHDVRGCRCRFLVRYDHDQSEEIVALRKICRRPETDYRLQQLHALNESASVNQNKSGANIHMGTLRVYPPVEVMPKPVKVEAAVTAPQSSLPGITEIKLQHRVEPVVLSPHNLTEAKEGKAKKKVESAEPAPSHINLPEVSEGEAQQREEPVVPAPSDNNKAKVGDAEAQQKGEVAVLTPPHSNQPEVSEGRAQQEVEPMVPAPTHISVPEASEGKVDREVEPVLPEPSNTNVLKGTDVEVQNEIEPVVAAPSLANVNAPEVAEVKFPQPDVEMSDADKESSSNIRPDNAAETSGTETTTGSDQEMQEAS